MIVFRQAVGHPLAGEMESMLHLFMKPQEKFQLIIRHINENGQRPPRDSSMNSVTNCTTQMMS